VDENIRATRLKRYAATEALTGRHQTLSKTITSLQQNGGIFEREILKLRGQINDLQR